MEIKTKKYLNSWKKQANNANEILKKEVNEAKTALNEMKKAKEQEKKSKNRNFIQSWLQKRLDGSAQAKQ